MSCSQTNRSRVMRKPTICIGKNRGLNQPRSNCEADQFLCFCFTDSLYPLLSKCHLLCLYSSVCPGRKPHCWFSHDAAHIHILLIDFICVCCSQLQWLSLPMHVFTAISGVCLTEVCLQFNPIIIRFPI